MRCARHAADLCGDTFGIELDGLRSAELASLLATTQHTFGHNAPEVVAGTLADRTAGNPLYASQLIRHWGDAGFDPGAVPASLRDVVWSRVRAVGPEATEVLTAASVLGTDFDEDVLIAMLSLPEAAVVETLEAATRAGLLDDVAVDGRSLRFVHALVAGALYAGAAPSSRTRLHEAAALDINGFAANRRREPQVNSPAISRSWAVPKKRSTGRRGLWKTTRSISSHPRKRRRTIVAAFDLAAAHDRPPSERADLLVRLGDALAPRRRSGGARDDNRGVAPAAGLGGPGAADSSRVRRRPRVHAPRRWRAGIPVDDRTGARGRRSGRHRDVRTLARAPGVEPRVHTGRGAAAAAADEALDLAGQHGDPIVLAQVAPAALYALWGLGCRELRQRVAADAIRVAGAAGDPRLEFAAHQAAYNVAVESADPVIAARSLAAMRAIAGAVPEPRLRWTLGIYDTFDATMAGRLEDAEALATATLDLGSPIAPDAFTFFAGQLFVIGSFSGRHEELLPLVEQAASDNPGVVPFALAYGISCAAAGRFEIARDILSEGVQIGSPRSRSTTPG